MLAVSAALAPLRPETASGERHQQGNLIASLDGSLSPLQLPRKKLAPVALHLTGALQTEDGSALPRVTRLEFALPSQGALDTRGLPTCSPRRLRYASTEQAIASCGPALVGRGRLDAQIVLPDQPPFALRARLLAFNARIDGRPAVVVHGYAPHPATIAVLRFRIGRSEGGLGTRLIGRLPRALGPWPRVARFEMRLSRRFSYQGKPRSYLRASCPLPPALTAGFFPLARVGFELAGGGRVAATIVRGCRAR